MFINELTLEYPIYEGDIKALYPNTSWSNEQFVPPPPFKPLIATSPPLVGLFEVAEESTPVFEEGQWKIGWSTRQATLGEINIIVNRIKNTIIGEVQNRLDEFARTRNYDGILSACTYATSTIPNFAAEGQYCVNARDATWTTLYSIMAAVQAQLQPMPTSYNDIESELPELVWPT